MAVFDSLVVSLTCPRAIDANKISGQNAGFCGVVPVMNQSSVMNRYWNDPKMMKMIDRNLVNFKGN